MSGMSGDMPDKAHSRAWDDKTLSLLPLYCSLSIPDTPDIPDTPLARERTAP